jgi:hypothetical protein
VRILVQLPRDLGGSFCPRRFGGNCYRFRIAVDPFSLLSIPASVAAGLSR